MMYSWAPNPMNVAHPAPARAPRGYRSVAYHHPMVPFYHGGDPMVEDEGSLSPHALKKHEELLKPLKDLGKVDPQFEESKDGNSYVLNLDLPGMDKDKVDVSVSGNMISIKGAVRDEESWKTQDGGASRSVSSSAVTRSYVAPGPISGAKTKTKWDGSKLVVTMPKADSKEAIEYMDRDERAAEGVLAPLTSEDDTPTLWDAWNDMEQEMETILRPFGGDIPSFGHHVQLSPEERKSIEEHHVKEEEAKEKLRQAYEERRAKEEEIRTKRVMASRRRNMFTELERDGDDLKLSVLVPEGTSPELCTMAVEEDRFGRQYLLVDVKGPDGKVVKERRLPLSDEIDPNAISAKFDDKEGKLNIVLMQRKPKQISIDIMKD